MKIEFCHSSPHTPLANDLINAFHKTRQLDIVVAFLTKHGVDFLEQQLALMKANSWRLVVSVRWPTNLEAVKGLAEKYPDRIWIHLAGLVPAEKKANRYQLHSKLVLLAGDHGSVEIFVGSHNWTYLALQGGNIEAGVRITCNSSDPIAQDAYFHIESCIKESERFDPRKLHYYKIVQSQLQETAPSEPSPLHKFDRFTEEQRLILLAEAQFEDIYTFETLQVYFTLPSGNLDPAINLRKEVDLYLFKPGHLINSEKPRSLPTHYSGKITMLNDADGGAVRERAVNTCIPDLEKPIIESLTTVPDSQEVQVIVTLNRKTTKELPIFHNGSKPQPNYKVDYETSTPPWALEFAGKSSQEYLTPKSLDNTHLNIQIPFTVFEQIEVNIPNPELYSMDPYKKLQLKDNDLHDNNALPRVYIPAQRERQETGWETKYFYKVTHREIDG